MAVEKMRKGKRTFQKKKGKDAERRCTEEIDVIEEFKVVRLLL